jgi:2-methylisocitrate lyase-like PEP mutase family enzyme
LFAAGVTDKETITQLVRELEGPLNVLAMPGIPPVAELSRLGVRRVSLGSGPMRATLGLLVRMARQLMDGGLFDLMHEGAMPYPDANRLVQASKSKP